MNVVNKCLMASAALASLLGQQAVADSWAFELEPYLMAVSIEGDAGVGRVTGAEVDVDTDAVLETLEMGAMIHFEALHDSGWGAIVDYSFMDLGADIQGSRGGVVDAQVRQGVLQLEAFYRQQLDASTLDYSMGIRWWDNDIDVEVDLGILPGSLESEVEADWVDVFMGLRWIKPLNSNWQLLARGDVGGAGLEADFTASVSLGARYRLGQSMVLDMAYRGTWVDYSEGSKSSANYFSYDTVTHGPLVGLIFEF
ncbi:MAG: hypothetical protein ACRBBW_16670 [Cellvibrionaceae bacterium]